MCVLLLYQFGVLLKVAGLRWCVVGAGHWCGGGLVVTIIELVKVTQLGVRMDIFMSLPATQQQHNNTHT